MVVLCMLDQRSLLFNFFPKRLNIFNGKSIDLIQTTTALDIEKEPLESMAMILTA